MKTIIYVSGIIGIILLVVRLLGIFLEFPQNDLILLSGIILLGLVCLPSYFIDKYRHEKKMDNVIKPYNGQQKKSQTIQESDSKTKGWGMNNSPFRERRSGMTWGGGNIHGANASRGKRKSFLR